jgi:hypothetical protein
MFFEILFNFMSWVSLVTNIYIFILCLLFSLFLFWFPYICGGIHIYPATTWLRQRDFMMMMIHFIFQFDVWERRRRAGVE